MTQHLIDRYSQVLQRIENACHSAARKTPPRLLAVSKTKPLEDIITLAKQGQKAFGENYVQEALEKIAARPDLEWHFIGPIQSNKTRPIAEHFAWVHSVDRIKIANRLSQQRPSDLSPLNILLEVNISEEDTKSGFSAQAILEMAPQIAKLPNLNLRGLMAIPKRAETSEEQRKPFAKMRELLQQLQQQLPDQKLDTLSMGMSADLEAAIMEGATIVRIGTDIFGARDYPSNTL